MRATLHRTIPLAALWLACGPLGPLPGGELDGEPATTPPGDWSFTAAHDTVQLEVRPSDPYSVNLWCVATAGQLYIAAGGDSRAWAGALLEDPRARLRVGTQLYEVRAARVSDAAEIRTYLEALSEKYSISDAELSDFQDSADAPASAMLLRFSHPAE